MYKRQDTNIPEITEPEYWDPSESDYAQERNLIAGLPQQIEQLAPFSAEVATTFYNSKEDATMLTDGKFASKATYADTAYFRFTNGLGRTIIYDLGKESAVSSFMGSFLFESSSGVNLPRRLVIKASQNGVDWQTIHTTANFQTLESAARVELTESFDKTMDENPAIAMSFRNQFVPSINYTYTFDKTYGATGNRRFYWQNSVTSAGNLLSGILRAFGQRQPQTLFGNRFSQFVKEVSEVKFYHRLGRRNNWLATRFLVGVGYAYGNSEVMPYSEQFYIGGANSIRAFTIRSLGPGSYRPPADDRNGYLDQTGDFKLEANVEYRFGIMGRLNGAVFLDAGNIWLLKSDPKRPGAELKWKGLLDEIALGTGFGLRYDISYLVIRADLGIGLHTPYPNPDKKGYYNISSFKDGLGFHLAIGYPF